MKKRLLITALALVMLLSAVPFTNAASLPFTDVPTNHRHRTAIEFCVANEFVKGYTDTTFVPDGTLTREQFAVLWARTIHVRMHKFTDVEKVTNELDNAIVIMQALGHINGVSDTLFSRTGTLTREQAVTIAYRAYLPGNESDGAEEAYPDHESISDWAKNAVGVCLEKGLLDGVFTGTDFKPQQAMTRSEICQMIYNIMRVEFEITPYTSEEGNVTADKEKAYPGELVTLSVAPADGKRLIPGSIKINDTALTGFKFTMPFEDVVISAAFEDASPLTAIEVTRVPDKIAYKWGDTLDLTGIKITATYEDESTRDVTDEVTFDPVNGSRLYSTGILNVAISFTENEVTKTAEQPINVSP